MGETMYILHWGFFSASTSGSLTPKEGSARKKDSSRGSDSGRKKGKVTPRKGASTLSVMAAMSTSMLPPEPEEPLESQLLESEGRVRHRDEGIDLFGVVEDPFPVAWVGHGGLERCCNVHPHETQ